MELLGKGIYQTNDARSMRCNCCEIGFIKESVRTNAAVLLRDGFQQGMIPANDMELLRDGISEANDARSMRCNCCEKRFIKRMMPTNVMELL